MAKIKSKLSANDKVARRIYSTLTGIVAVVLLAVAGLAFWAHLFIGNMVTEELSVQKIYFPEKGSPALDPETYPDLQKYAGELVDTPQEAKAYANGYIARHLEATADGKVYSEISTEARLNPTDETLQAQKATLFQGETLRGILLTSGYAFGTIGQIAGIAAGLLVALAGALGISSVLLRRGL